MSCQKPIRSRRSRNMPSGLLIIVFCIFLVLFSVKGMFESYEKLNDAIYGSHLHSGDTVRIPTKTVHG